MNERVVGNFKILSKVGEGGMGSVYRGVDMMLDRDVAIKVLRPELARDPQLVERFRKEAKALAKLSHPAVAMVYSFFREGDELFLVMEFVEGRTLDKVLRADGPFDPREAVRLFGIILEGIATAHRQGVIHRDIKPENIMVTPDGGAKIMDFGIAWMVGQARMTRAGHLIGTPHYMSPEQVRGEDPGVASDIYSLGAVLYELATGQLPLNADSDFEIMKAQVERDPQPPRNLSNRIPIWLNDAILQALAKDPAGRFADAASFGRALTCGAQHEWSENESDAGEMLPPDVRAMPPTRVAEAPPTRLAAATPPPPTRLAQQPKNPPAPAGGGGTGDGFRRAAAWFVGLGPATRFLAGVAGVAVIAVLVLMIAVLWGSRNSGVGDPMAPPPTPFAMADAAPAQPKENRQGPAVTRPQGPPPEPVQVSPTNPPPRRAEPQPPTPRGVPDATAVPEPTRPPPTVITESEAPNPAGAGASSAVPRGDPRDGAPTIGEAFDMAGEVEAATDSLTKTLRRFLESRDRWRPEGVDRELWEEIKAFETATDQFKSYVRNRRGLKILRKDTHPTGWTKNEIAEARAKVRDMVGRIPQIESALSRADVMPLIIKMWRATRDEVEKLDRRMSIQ